MRLIECILLVLIDAIFIAYACLCFGELFFSPYAILGAEVFHKESRGHCGRVLANANMIVDAG